MFIMANGNLKWEELKHELKEARKDPEFKKELNRFIAITSGKTKVAFL